MKTAAMRKNPPSFEDVPECVRLGDAARDGRSDGALVLRGWLRARDLAPVIKQSFLLSKGCVRHLLYLASHTGSYLDARQARLNVLLNAYRRSLTQALWSVAPHGGGECRIELLRPRLTQANHLLYLFLRRLTSSGERDGAHSPPVASLFPCPPHALRLDTTIAPGTIGLLSSLLRSWEEGACPPVLLHALFLSLFHAERVGAPFFDSGGSHARYRSHVVRSCMRQYLLLRSAAPSPERCPPHCSADRPSLPCLRAIFDVKADECLVRVAGDYLRILPVMTELERTGNTQLGGISALAGQMK
jgi:hypothetical protein